MLFRSNTLSGVTASISNSGLSSGWYRCSVTVNAAASVSPAINLFLSTTGTVTSYTGDGVSGLYVYGLQVNSGATALPYYQTGLLSIPTNTPLQANPTCNGLLIEESRTNILYNSSLLQSQSISTAANTYTLSFYSCNGSISLSGSHAANISGNGFNQQVYT